MRLRISVFLVVLGFSIGGYAQAKAYQLTVDNQAVIFTFINKTCNGGRIDLPPQSMPLSPPKIYFEIQSDAQQGCMLRYEDNKYNLLGIWIHQGQVECNNQGGFYAYHCTFIRDELIIKNPK